MYAGHEQAAGNANSVRQADQSAAMEALRELESRLRTAEEEVSEFKFKVCARVSWLFAFDLSPVNLVSRLSLVIASSDFIH